jgi:hypothetical protein
VKDVAIRKPACFAKANKPGVIPAVRDGRIAASISTSNSEGRASF